LNYPGGALGYFKANHVAQKNNVCSNNLPYPALLQTLNDDTTLGYPNTVYYNSVKNFQLYLTAPHTPSAYFVFMTQYKSTAYRPDPSWQDLKFVCASDNGGTKTTDTFKCQFPMAPADINQLSSRQVVVTVWQRMDPAGENFISCADVKMDQGIAPEPEIIWSKIGINH